MRLLKNVSQSVHWIGGRPVQPLTKIETDHESDHLDQLIEDGEFLVVPQKAATSYKSSSQTNTTADEANQEED